MPSRSHTTLRTVLHLVTPTAGKATIGGVPYIQLADPLRYATATRCQADLEAGLHTEALHQAEPSRVRPSRSRTWPSVSPAVSLCSGRGCLSSGRRRARLHYHLHYFVPSCVRPSSAGTSRCCHRSTTSDSICPATHRRARRCCIRSRRGGLECHHTLLGEQPAVGLCSAAVQGMDLRRRPGHPSSAAPLRRRIVSFCKVPG